MNHKTRLHRLLCCYPPNEFSKKETNVQPLEEHMCYPGTVRDKPPRAARTASVTAIGRDRQQPEGESAGVLSLERHQARAMYFLASERLLDNGRGVVAAALTGERQARPAVYRAAPVCTTRSNRVWTSRGSRSQVQGACIYDSYVSLVTIQRSIWSGSGQPSFHDADDERNQPAINGSTISARRRS